jgi:dCTP diphosphatase
MNDINELVEQIKKFRDERDWKQFHTHKDMALSVMLEAAELAEHFQWKTKEQAEDYAKTHKNEIAEEVADVAVYLLEFCDILGIDFIDAIKDKLAKNAVKYPVDKAKGNAKKYTEL